MQQIAYILSAICLLITLILVKKSKNKISFIKYFFISIVIFMCYNAFVCYALDLANIKLTLLNLTSVNFIFAGIITIFIVKKKEIQTYSINKKDILAFIIILIVGITILFVNYGFDINIKYLTTDSAIHFGSARYLYQESEQLDNLFQTGAYTNTGILFKLVSDIIGYTNLHKAFIVFDTFTFILMGLALYCAIEKLIKTKFNFAISMIAIVVFMLGYPLNSFVFGYVYLQVGLIIVATIINVLQLFSDEVDRKQLYIGLALLNFGIFFSYCIFIPIVYIVEFIYIYIKRYKETKKIISIKNILIFIGIFAIPIICGLCRFVIPHLVNAAAGDIPAFYDMEGYIYRNCWSNFILILPLALLCLKKKNDETMVWGIFTCVLVIGMLIYFILIRKFDIMVYVMVWSNLYIKYNRRKMEYLC